jgi:hypothetical protein
VFEARYARLLKTNAGTQIRPALARILLSANRTQPLQNALRLALAPVCTCSAPLYPLDLIPRCSDSVHSVHGEFTSNPHAARRAETPVTRVRLPRRFAPA